MIFQYDRSVVERFPGIVGGIILAREMRNGPTPGALLDAFISEQKATLARLGDTPLSEVASLSAWRRAFSGFGVSPTQYRSAAEALLRRLTKSGDLPSINLLVDLGNLVSIRYALPVAVFDVRGVIGAITVRFARGNERFTNLGSSEVEHPEPGEVIFVDETDLVIARRWCWRQSDEVAARLDTSDAIVTIEGHHAGARTAIDDALTDLSTLLQTYAGGDQTIGVADGNTLAVGRS